MKETETAVRKELTKSPVTAFISEEQRDKVLRIARREELKLSDVIRRAIKEYTDKYGV